MTQRLAKPASSAVLPISASLGPIPTSLFGQVKLGICSPMRTSVSPLAPPFDRQILSSGATRGASGSHPRESFEEAVHVFFGVVEVWRDAHALAAYADEDVLFRESGGEIFRSFGAELQADHVPRPALYRDRLDAVISGFPFYEVRQASDGLGDILYAPVEDLAQGFVRHREQGEVAPLADVVAAGTGLEGVLVAHEPGEVLAAAAVDPVVLDRRPLPPPFAGVHKPDPVRPEQPLVHGGNQEVGAHLPHVERVRSERLYAVDHERRTCLPGMLADAFEVEQCPVRPVAVRHGPDSGVLVQMVEYGGGPVVVGEAGDGHQVRAAALR